MKMKKVRKFLVIIMAMGMLLSGMTVMAEESKYYDGYPGHTAIQDDGTARYYYGYEAPTDDNTPDDKHPVLDDLWRNFNDSQWYVYDGSKWVLCESESSSSSEKNAEAEESARKAARMEAARIEAARMEAEARSEGFKNAAQMQYAQWENKSASEYYNNAVVVTEGIEEATPVAQGGNLVVDGKVTNMTAMISKVSVAFVDSVRASQEGTVLNVVDVQFPAAEAVINFYMPGVANDADIAAVQYVDGAWVDVEVEEVRADHVILNLKSNGVVAFLAK